MIIHKINKLLNEESYDIPIIKREKSKKLNLKTNRMKTSRKTMFHTTDISPSDRTFKNLPRYASGKPKVRFQDWLLIKSEKISPDHSVPSFGKSEADGKFYGWSHRAVYGFKPGQEIKPGSIGNKYDKDNEWDENGKDFKPYIIKTEQEAREHAIRFSQEVS